MKMPLLSTSMFSGPTDSDSEWYLVKTKPNREFLVRDQLSSFLPEVLLPIMCRLDLACIRTKSGEVPLFPSYLFTRFRVGTHYLRVKYTPGVRYIVSAGDDPLSISQDVIEEIKGRLVNGRIIVKRRPLSLGERIRIADGPLAGAEAVFQHYLSGTKRVALLLETVYAKGVRIVMPTALISRLCNQWLVLDDAPPSADRSQRLQQSFAR
jgi:transcription antitermination factor NusG